VVSAAKRAADFAAVMESDAPVGGAAAAEEFETVDIERDSMLTLPQGWKMSQFKAEQPTDTYAAFKSEIVNEMARPFCMPLNVALGNSANYNYASGRLDYQMYHQFISVVRKWIAKQFLDKVFNLWMSEARLAATEGTKPDGDGVIDWYWPGAEHVDPQKEANAQDTRLKNYSTTYAAEYARQGKDWQIEFEQIGREKAKMKAEGITLEDVQNANPKQDEPEDEEKPKPNARLRIG
jgi:capsid protein